MARMKSKSTLPKASKANEFRGRPDAVKRAERLDRKSDKAIAKKTGTKWVM